MTAPTPEVDEVDEAEGPDLMVVEYSLDGKVWLHGRTVLNDPAKMQAHRTSVAHEVADRYRYPGSKVDTAMVTTRIAKVRGRLADDLERVRGERDVLLERIGAAITHCDSGGDSGSVPGILWPEEEES